MVYADDQLAFVQDCPVGAKHDVRPDVDVLQADAVSVGELLRFFEPY